MCHRLVSLTAVLAIAPAVHVSAGWTSLPNLPGSKHHAMGLQVGGVVYAIGGPPWANRGDEDGSVYAFDGTSWSSAAAIDGEGPVLGLGGGIDSLGRIIIFGGINSDNGDDGKGKVYDPASGTVGSIPDRHDNAPLEHFAVARDESGRLYSIGGGAGASGANTGFTERYVASSNSWQSVASVPVGVADAAACSDGNGHILVFGGFNSNGSVRSADVWRLDVASNTWNNTIVPDLPMAITHAVAVRGNDQRIYVIGGESGTVPGGTVQSSVYILNLIDNTWSAGPSMSVPRRDHAAALSTGDFIVVAGGTTTGGAAVNSAEALYAPTCPTHNRGKDRRSRSARASAAAAA
jgi:N-acetylneuraminic acid mutarotase